MSGAVSEKLFAALCGQAYLKGFVFHSPKRDDPAGQGEAGDVVLWVRDLLVVFEVIWRDASAGGNTKSFVRRIGEKRDQLIEDYRAYADQNLGIRMTNEAGEKILFDHEYFVRDSFCGVVIVDSDSPLEKLHFETVRKSLHQEFPIAFMKRQDFLDLLIEVDTPADLLYYLNDRAAFVKSVFDTDAGFFLDLNSRHERELIGFYKVNDNSFPIDEWRKSETKDFWLQYQLTYGERIARRNEENDDSFIIDEMIDLLRSKNSQDDLTLLHSWELAVLPRRSRATIAPEIADGFEQMANRRACRQFAFYNKSTACWILFYFRYGGDSENFRKDAEQMTRMKMHVERFQSDYEHSVFCFAFRKSSVETGNSFDECVLLIEDAENHLSVSLKQYEMARSYFMGAAGGKTIRLREFPT